MHYCYRQLLKKKKSETSTQIPVNLTAGNFFFSSSRHCEMLQKTGVKQRSGFLKFVAKSAKILFVVEVVAFASTYAVWHRLNTNRGK